MVIVVDRRSPKLSDRQYSVDLGLAISGLVPVIRFMQKAGNPKQGKKGEQGINSLWRRACPVFLMDLASYKLQPGSMDVDDG